MDEALYHKFTQHNDLRAELLATGDAELVEVSITPKFLSTDSEFKSSTL